MNDTMILWSSSLVCLENVNAQQPMVFSPFFDGHGVDSHWAILEMTPLSVTICVKHNGKKNKVWKVWKNTLGNLWYAIMWLGNSQ
jgi:hypothetical protein